MSILIDKRREDEILNKIASMRKNSEVFHKTYVEPYTLSEKFNSLRLTYLNRLDEIVKIFIFI